MKSEINKNESGLAHIGIIIAVILVVAALAFGGWYVWDKNKEDKKPADSTSLNNKQDKEKTEPPAGWKLYQNNEAGFSFYYPPEWGEVEETGNGSLEFSSLDELIFRANQRDKEHTEGHFGILQLNNAVGVSLSGAKASVTFLTGSNPTTREQEFGQDEIIKTLSDTHACVLEDVSVYESYMNDPELKNSYVYFGYCGLSNATYGAVSFTSDSLDITDSKTEQFRSDLTKLLQTFELHNQ